MWFHHTICYTEMWNGSRISVEVSRTILCSYSLAWSDTSKSIHLDHSVYHRLNVDNVLYILKVWFGCVWVWVRIEVICPVGWTGSISGSEISQSASGNRGEVQTDTLTPNPNSNPDYSALTTQHHSQRQRKGKRDEWIVIREIDFLNLPAKLRKTIRKM